jgi:hypothetical protein
MGRPPIGKRAMTSAERQRRHRDSKPVTKPKPFRDSVTKPTQFRDDAHVTKLEERLAMVIAGEQRAVRDIEEL